MTKKQKFALLYVAVAALGFSLKPATKPAWNFDVLGYVAAAVSWSGASTEEVHSEAYGTLEAELPSEAFESLIAASEYRKALHANPEFLATQIPFYANKPGYVAALWGLARAGVSLPIATQVVSIGAFFALAALISAWIVRRSARALDLLFAGPFLFFSAHAAAGYATPDLLSALVVSSAAFAVIELGRYRLAVLLLVLACAVRPDNFIFALLLLAWLAWRGDRAEPRARAVALAGVVLVLSSVFVTQRLTGAYPWGTLLQHTFVERLFVPEKMSETISVSDYFQALGHGLLLKDTPDFPLVPLFALMAFLTWRELRKDPTPEGARNRELHLISVASIVLHYVGFPLLADRFFVAQYWLVFAVALPAHRAALEQVAMKRA